MLTVRHARDRGHADHGWLDTWHTFSFADYHDEAHMGFRALRVINDDRIAPGAGFPMHSHRDMEIITYVLEGALEHRDSLGHGEILRAGEVQHMTAGAGIRHSESNPSPTEPIHLYQIWLLPDRRGHQPAYAQKAFPESERTGRWQTIASPDGRDGSLPIKQDVTMHLANVDTGSAIHFSFAPQRYGWLQVLRGKVKANGHALETGDGLAISEVAKLDIQAAERAELMLFDLN